MKLLRLVILALTAAALAAAGTGVAQEGVPAPSLNPLSSLDASELGGFRGRPLFAPSRRPVQPPTVVEAAPPEPVAEGQPNLRLTGVIESPQESVAVVQNLDANETWQLRLGDRVSGWLVTSIDPVTLKLTLGDRDEEYRLFADGR